MEESVEVKPHEKFEAVFYLRISGDERLATKNFAPGVSVYGERLIVHDSYEYRLWDPHRSKLSAFIKKNGKKISVEPGFSILYLGASTGTTLSHVSDIVGVKGKVYGVEFSARVMRVLLENLCKYRQNIYPIFMDARFPDRYPIPSIVDGIYCDIAQPEQARILVENAKLYLKKGGYAMIALKARSIDVTKPPDQIFKEEIKTLRMGGFEVLESLRLEPYDKDHTMVVSYWPH